MAPGKNCNSIVLCLGLFSIATASGQLSSEDNTLKIRCGDHVTCDKLAEYCDVPAGTCRSCQTECSIPSRNASCHILCKAYLEVNRRVEEKVQKNLQEMKGSQVDSSVEEPHDSNNFVVNHTVLAIMGLLTAIVFGVLIACHWKKIRSKYMQWRGLVPDVDPEAGKEEEPKNEKLSKEETIDPAEPEEPDAMPATQSSRPNDPEETMLLGAS